MQGVTVNGTLMHSGHQYADSNNSLRMPAWTRLDLGVQYAMPWQQTRLTWRAGVENVTNAKYWETIGQDSGYLTQGDPRTVKLSVSVDF
ncbi:Ferrichrome receptor FcuA precursor [Tatumella ptyseos]|nr:TonB-dependent receptor [Tatumella ptyseos]SQK74850.1 Ferrichrome receptor FcuA precursor [Tatumella ptyseos]